MRVQFISDVDLAKIAHRYLKQHGHLESVPIDIELLCEQVGVSILPTSGLKQKLSIDAFLTNNCTMIVIDQDCFNNSIPRARFSIAHELSHRILHEHLYSKANVNDLKSYKAFQASVSGSLKRIEIQAYTLAGHLLMPPDLLKQEILQRTALYGDIGALSIGIAEDITTQLLELFNVSDPALARQLQHVSPEFSEALLQRT